MDRWFEASSFRWNIQSVSPLMMRMMDRFRLCDRMMICHEIMTPWHPETRIRVGEDRARQDRAGLWSPASSSDL